MSITWQTSRKKVGRYRSGYKNVTRATKGEFNEFREFREFNETSLNTNFTKLPLFSKFTNFWVAQPKKEFLIFNL